MDWSTNPLKLARAKANAGVNATEEQIKAEYIRLGGLVHAEETYVIKAPEPLTNQDVADMVKPVKKAVKKTSKKK